MVDLEGSILNRRKRSRHHPSAAGLISSQMQLLVLCGFLLIVFLTGGSSRADASSILLLRPISFLVLGYGFISLSQVHIRNYWPLVLIAVATVVLTALHLMPLPAVLWHALPGRQIIMEIDHLTGLGEIWRPLSFDPQATRNALMALATPCAVLILAIQLKEREHKALLTFVLGLGILTAVWALLQLLGSPRGPLYLYDLTNYGSAVGLFANRNHQAVFLASLVPLMYCWTQLAHGSWKDISSDRGRRVSAAGAGALLLIPLTLIAGSRAGLLALILSICITAAGMILVSMGGGRRKQRRRSMLTRIAPIATATVVLGTLAFLTISLGRDRAFERLIGTDPIANLRADLLPVTWDIAVEHLPWGTGIGSFDDVFRIYEADALLGPEYVNHAHNDALEIFMTGGAFGVLIMAFGGAIFAFRSWSIARGGIADIRANIWPAAALTALGILFIASLVDYPLRTPAMASYAVLLAIWASNGRRAITS